jgi:large subunit ribosomal protein L9
MEAEILLIQDVERLGKRGDIIRVAPGFARNFLFPKKLAAPATPKHLRMLELEKKRKEADGRRQLKNMGELAEKLNQFSCTIPMQAGEDGKLFGSVTAQDIAEALEKAGYTIDKRQVELTDAIKELGVYTVSINLHSEVKASVKIWVVEK